MNIVTLLDIQAKDREQIEGLYKKKLLRKKNVITYADVLSRDQADVEDLFDRDFYVLLVNREFDRQLLKSIKAAYLNESEPRNTRAIEKFVSENPLKSGRFNHYRPARYFVENIATLWPEVSGETEDRFESLELGSKGV